MIATHGYLRSSHEGGGKRVSSAAWRRPAGVRVPAVVYTVHGPKLADKKAGECVKVKPLVGLAAVPAFSIEAVNDVFARGERDIRSAWEVAAAAVEAAVGFNDARVGKHLAV